MLGICTKYNATHTQGDTREARAPFGPVTKLFLVHIFDPEMSKRHTVILDIVVFMIDHLPPSGGGTETGN